MTERLVDARALQALVDALFRAAGTPGDEAAMVADALVLADLRGMQSHGVLRVPTYIAKVRGGGFRPGHKGRVLRETAGTVLLDGEDGLGVVVSIRAMDEAMRKARACGIGAAGVTNGNHCGTGASAW